jgi:hypothetical protein
VVALRSTIEGLMMKTIESQVDEICKWRSNSGLREAVIAAMTSAVDAARAAALESAEAIADGYDVPCEPRTEAEQVAHSISTAIAALITSPPPPAQPDLIHCWHCGEARERDELELVTSNDTGARFDYSDKRVLVCKRPSDTLDSPCSDREAAREDKEQARDAALRLALPFLRAYVQIMTMPNVKAKPEGIAKATAARDAVAALLRDAGGEQ